MEKLPQEFKKKWVAALRSGEYKQGKTFLCKDGKYCSLGVACAIMDIKIPVLAKTISSFYDLRGISKIPKLIRGYKNPVVTKLSGMNDRGAPFSEIADYIEQNL